MQDKITIMERKMKMIKIYEAVFYEDAGILQVVLANGIMEHIKPEEENDKFQMGEYARSQLQKLLEESPTEYAELVLNDRLENYIQLCIAEGASLSNNLNSYFEKHHPNATRAEIDGMISEFMMYDS